mgnify:CR=1 FL=1
MNKKLSSTTGATLIELMGAVLIFMIGIAALLGVFYSSVGMAKRAERAYTAYNLAKNHIEELKSYGFTDLVEGEVTSVVDQNGAAYESGDKYIRTTTTTNCADATPCTGSLIDSNLTEIDVKVWYVLRDVQSAGPMEATTLIFENG